MLDVTVVVPCRNEQHFVGVFDQIIKETNQSLRAEFLFVDGMSDDGTPGLIQVLISKYSNVRLIENKERTTPQALNLGIDAARGKFICRMDCHSHYPRDYVGQLYVKFQNFQKIHPDMANLGGIVKTLPRRRHSFSRAVSEVLSSNFGVGGSVFRTLDESSGVLINVDTVPFGFFNLETLRQIGGFDEDMVKNQDDHLNAALIAAGYKVKCDPSIVIEYYPRDRVSELWNMFFNYGFYKPLSVFKLRHLPTLRQLVPGGFVLYLLSIPVAFSFLDANSFYLYLIPFYIYALLLGFACGSLLSPLLYLCKMMVFPLVHTSYGLGYLIGVFRWIRNVK
jgi:glycosyltransferase involved in cell wall biosynthesis